MKSIIRCGLILFLVIFQTTIYFIAPAFNHFIDLLITYVIYAGLFLPVVENVILIFLLGLFMDSITVGPFGLYLSIYFWIIVGLRPFVMLLNLKNIHSLRLLLGIAFIFENMMLFLGTIVLKQEITVSSEPFCEMLYQLLWTLILGPYLIKILRFVDDH